MSVTGVNVLNNSGNFNSTNSSQEEVSLSNLPQDVIEEIFSHIGSGITPIQVDENGELKGSDLGLLMATRLKDAFGKDKWKLFFGVDVGEEPPIPPNIYEILESPCPFWEGKKVRETHMLVLLPKTINGESLTLNKLIELVKSPNNGNSTYLRYIKEEIVQKLGDNAIDESYWFVMTNDVIEGSRDKAYAAQKELVQEKTHGEYSPPTCLEALACSVMHHVIYGEHLLGRERPTFTRCQDLIGDYPVVVGGFASGGLYVGYDFDYASGSYGVAACRKFC